MRLALPAGPLEQTAFTEVVDLLALLASVWLLLLQAVLRQVAVPVVVARLPCQAAGLWVVVSGREES
jgi:hypothetical protein